jgi:NAD-dependent protein deacetylase/lipoamidase
MTNAEAVPELAIDDSTWVLALTGAGVSAESGIRTFRDAGGLWEDYPVEQVASPGGFAADPTLVWRFYSARRAKAKTCAPNPGHLALADLERRLGDRFLLATQNVDGLHRQAGSERVVEVHGSLFLTRCSACARPPFADDREYEEPPRCGVCAAAGRTVLLRPHIVWFGEMLDPSDLRRIGAFVNEARRHRFVFLAAGTSGAVYPAAGMVLEARAAGATTWLVNAEPADNARHFHHFVRGASGVILPRLLGSSS